MIATLTQAGGYAIVDARSRRKNGRYIDRAWLTRSEAAGELASLLKHYAPTSEWRARLSVQPCSLSIEDWERCVREAERAQRRIPAAPKSGTGLPGKSRIERRRAA